MSKFERKHDYFTPEEWDDLERVTERWSNAGRAREAIVYPANGDVIKAVYQEDHDAAANYRATVDRILTAAAARGWKRTRN